MAGQSGKRRGPGRQALGVASLTAVASGTTALVIGMGSAQVSQQALTGPYADGNAGGPLVVDQPRTPVQVPPAYTAPSNRTGAPRAVGVARPVGPVGPVAGPVAGPVVRPVTPVPGDGRPGIVAPLPGDDDPVVPPVTGPTRPLPGSPGRPGVQDPDDDDNPGAENPDSPDSPIPGDDNPDDDGPDSPDSPIPGDPNPEDPEFPEVPGAPVGPSIPVDDGTICGIDAEGMQLPADVVRRLEEWLCGTTGRTVTVVAKPLRLVPPVKAAMPVKVAQPVTVPARHAPKHAARNAERPAAKTATAAKHSKAGKAKKGLTARDVAARKAKTRGSSRHEDEQSRGNESRRHEGESRGHDHGRGRGHDDLRGLLQREVNVLGTVVRQAEAGASWNYSGRHRPGR